MDMGIRSLKSTRNNIFGRLTLSQMIVGTVALGVVCGILNFAIQSSGITRVLLVIIAGITALIYLRYFMLESVLYNTVGSMLHGLDWASGAHKISKHYSTAEYLMRNGRLPIRKCHRGGVIEFNKHQYGLLLNLHPPRRNDNLPAYVRTLKKVVDSLPEGILLKTHTFSVIEAKPPLINQIRNVITDEATSQEMKKYLRSQHEAARGQPPQISWVSYGFIGLGKHKNVGAVGDTVDTQAAGVLKALADAGLQGDVIEDEYEIVLAYRQQMSMKRVF